MYDSKERENETTSSITHTLRKINRRINSAVVVGTESNNYRYLLSFVEAFGISLIPIPRVLLHKPTLLDFIHL